MSEVEPTLLLVDDSETNLDMLSRRLRLKGFVVLTATSGQTALRILTLQAVDLLVLDLMMPEMDGIEVLRRLRSQARLAQIPVIMATAKTESSDMVTALEHGADDYVTKPIEFEVLVARIRALLRRRPASSTVESPRVPATSLDTSLPHGLLSETRPLSDDPSPTAAPTLPRTYIGPGTILGEYQIEEHIGSGGFGSVYKAVHLKLKKPVAIKVLHLHLLSSEGTVRRFQIEGISGCRIKHPNAVTINDASTTSTGVPYLVMEYLAGTTLDAELRTFGTLPFRRLAPIISQVCDALIFAHEMGVIHRDIKPANIHLARVEDAEVVKVLDFGLAKLLEGNEVGHVTSGESLIGTPQFMAPERLLSKPSDGRADVYSLGATLYLCLTGQLPFGQNEESVVSQALKQINTPPLFIQRLRQDLPDELSVLVMSMLARSRRDRPALSEIKEQLAAIAASWNETWPPRIEPTERAPLEIGDTANVSLKTELRPPEKAEPAKK